MAPGYRSGNGRIQPSGWMLVPAAVLMLSFLVQAPAGATYQKIAVPYPAPSERSELFFHPDLEIMGQYDGGYYILSRPELTEELRARGFHVEVVTEDLQAAYAASLHGARDYGIWHTYQETVDEMNLIHSQFPNLTTAPSSIGTTWEGRTIWAMKVSDNPDVQEDEPEVLFDGVHHAREIMTVEDILHFIRYLCENYDTDPAIRFIVDNRQVWFIPILNVDGFVYNEQTYPNGGGMWRKNRRQPTSGCYGVDNNRNYTYEWVGGGSSTNPCDDTYRGPSPGSEPENQAIMAFINAHHFVTWQSYHSNSAQVLIPWAYTTAHTQDDALLRAIAHEMASTSGYTVGQPGEILYLVNGGSFDWGYGATTEHPKIFALTTEIGGSGFWPQPSERDGLIAENLHANIYLCQIAGAYLELSGLAVSADGNGNGRLDPGETASLTATVHNLGVLVGANNVHVTLACQDPYVVLTDASSTIGALAPGASGSNALDPFDLAIDATCTQGRSVNFTVHMVADGGLSVDGTVSMMIGQAPVLYSDDFEAVGSDWTQDPSHTAQTGAFVRADPVQTTYQPGDDTTPAPGVNAWFTAQNPNGVDGTDDVDGGISATRSSAINLAGQEHARLNLNYFMGQRDQGDDPGDFFRIDLSNDGGTTFPVNLVLLGDVTMTPNWHNLQADLEDFLPLTSTMMIRVQAADAAPANDIVEGGIDDVYIYGGSGDEPPSAPVLVSPPDGAQNQPAAPLLIVENAVDPEGEPLTYGFRVYADAALTQLVASVDGVAEGSGSTTSWTVDPPLAEGTWYWRAYAADPSQRGLYMTPASFAVPHDAASVAQGSAVAGPRLEAGPNPSCGDVRVRYYTPDSPVSTLKIYDANGRCIRTLDGARWVEGWQETTWDGLQSDGTRAPAGVYWVRLDLPGESRAVRVVQLR